MFQRSIFLLSVVLIVPGILAQGPKRTARSSNSTGIVVREPTPFGARGGGNDECGTAVNVVVTADCAGSFAVYDASGATSSLPAISCNDFTSPEANDLWFSFVAISAATYVEVEGSGNYDPVLEGFSGPCGALISESCADATFPPDNNSELMTMATEVGSTYFVRVYSYWNPIPTDLGFTLCIYGITDVAVNDLCGAFAVEQLTPGTPLSFSGDDTNALDTEGLGLPSVWHSFSTDQCLNVTIDLCGTTPARPGSFKALFTDCSLSTRVESTSDDLTTCGDGDPTIYFEALPAGTYYYPVLSDPTAGATGDYTMAVTGAVPIAYCNTFSIACDEYIARVIIGDIDNATACVAGAEVDHASLSADIEHLQTLPITVHNGPVIYEEDSAAVWVDWDQDLAFCGENERFALTSIDGGATFVGSITAPAGALIGTTRMRVRIVYDQVPMACGTSDFGEVEDYTMNVILPSTVHEHDLAMFSIHPNPNDGNMSLRVIGAIGSGDLSVVDALGRTVYLKRMQNVGQGPLLIALAGVVESGTYLVRFSTDMNTWVRQVIIQ